MYDLKKALYEFDFEIIYLQVEQKFAILGDFAKLFKGFIIIGKIWKINTVCLETSSTNKLKWSSLSKLYFGGYKRKHAKKRSSFEREINLTLSYTHDFLITIYRILKRKKRTESRWSDL